MSVSLRHANKGKRAALDLKIQLLLSLTDLLSVDQHCGDDTLAHYENAFMAISDELDEETRFAIASRIAALPQLPSSVLDVLASGRDRAVHYVLEHAKHVPPSRLMAAAAWQSASLALAVARRPWLDDETIRLLAERPEAEIVKTLLSNAALVIDPATLAHLSRRARHDAAIAPLLAARSDDQAVLRSLFLSADQDKRRHLMLEARRAYLGQNTASPPADEAMISRLSGLSIDANLHENLCLCLENTLHCPAHEAAHIVNDRQGEPLALWAAWCSIPAAVMAPIFNALMHDHPRQNNHCEYLLDIVRQMPFAVADDLLRAMISTPIAQRLKDKESPLAKLSPERKSQSWHIPARRPVSHTPSSATPPAAQLSSPSANQSANQSVMSRK